MQINKTQIEDIDKETISRYNKRLTQFGIDARTLGWGSKEDQITRFSAAYRHVDFSGKSILDIGCGLADFYEFLWQKKAAIKGYKGIDINENLIETTKKRFPQNQYEVRNILLNNFQKEEVDIVVMFGLLNFKLKDLDNFLYTQKMLTAAWGITGQTLIVDFLSTNLTPSYPKEDFVYYHDPKDTLNFCFTLTNNIVLVHDYPPIPQKEFMLILHKEQKS